MPKQNWLFKSLMAAALLSVLGIGLAPLAQADTQTIPALTKQAVFTIGSDEVQVDGRSCQMDVAPYIDGNGRTEVPVRYLGDVLGMQTGWNARMQTLNLQETAFSGGENLTVGSTRLGWVNGVREGVTTMDTTPVIVPPGRTMLPARWVAQAMGYAVTWNTVNQTVTITPPGSRTSTGGSGGPVDPSISVMPENTGVSSGTTPGPDSHNIPLE